jgi:hypothetical protein
VSDQTLMLPSLIVRSVADAAESHRGSGGEPGYMLTTHDLVNGWSTVFVPQTDQPAPLSDATVVVTPVDTRTVTERPAVLNVYIQAQGMQHGYMESLARYDAVFWSESAVEKFVLPYYASKSQYAAAEVLSGLSELFYHKIPSPDRTDESVPSPDRTDESVPFAVAHLPRSTYQNLTETAAMGADLAVVKRHPVTGEVTHHLLSHYLERRNAQRQDEERREEA